MESMVIKVKYGDTLRRFNARVNENEQLDLDMDGLRAKILGLFNFPLDADITLTYIDEDGDVVALVDDDDLRDVMRQSLKFLRVDVQLNNEKFGKSYFRSSGSSTPMRSPGVQPPLQNTDTGIAVMLKSVPEPLREALSNLSHDFASHTASSSSMVAEFVDFFSKMGQSYLNAVPPSHFGVDSSTQIGAAENPMASSVITDPNASKDGNMREVLQKSISTPKSSQEVDVDNVTRGVGAPFIPVCMPVDLNLDPPCDSNPSGRTTVNYAPGASNTPAGDDGKDFKESEGHLSGKPVGVSASICSADPVRPSNLNISHTTDLGVNLYECPFSGMPVANDSVVPPYGYRNINSFKRLYNRPSAMVGMFHKGVRCDGCGVLPITGPRFKSKVKEDYDLCSICFAEMGNEADYIRIDRPMSHRHQRSCKGSYNHLPGRGIPTPLPRILRNCGVNPVRSKLDSRFILDVNVLDGTVIAPFTPFTKIWRMHNSGSIAWPRGAQLVWIGGDKFSAAVSTEIEMPADGLPVNGELDIAVDFMAPGFPGQYISYWRMASPSGTKFGQRVWVHIQVDASLNDSFCDSLQGLNLNLPPASSGVNGCEIIDVNVQPIMDGGFLEPGNSSIVTAERLKPMVDKQPKKDQEQKFPINDSLLIGHGVSSAPPQVFPSVSYPVVDPPQAPPSVSYPVVDPPQAPPSVSYPIAGPPQAPSLSYPIVDLLEALAEPSNAPINGGPTSSGGVSESDSVEQALLKELEQMGFKQVDLNKEILRMNEYNLEQSVDDLCGVSEWDPILEELQEMGFCDEETNKRLLKKNNGSIKRVVMELLSGEKA